MRHDEERDNTTDIEANLSEADIRADIENTAIYNPGSWKAQRLAQAERPIENRVADAWWTTLNADNAIGHFNMSDIPEDGVRSVDVFNGKGRRIFSISVSADGVAYQVLQQGEDENIYATEEDEV